MEHRVKEMANTLNIPCAWEHVTEERVQQLVSSMPERMSADHSCRRTYKVVNRTTDTIYYLSYKH